MITCSVKCDGTKKNSSVDVSCKTIGTGRTRLNTYEAVDTCDSIATRFCSAHVLVQGTLQCKGRFVDAKSSLSRVAASTNAISHVRSIRERRSPTSPDDTSAVALPRNSKYRGLAPCIRTCLMLTNIACQWSVNLIEAMECCRR